MELVGISAIILVALVFDYTNGFHDAANSVATSVGTRALNPKAALAIAAVFNLIGGFLGHGVAKTVGQGIIQAPAGNHGLAVIFSALVGAITWNIVTWYFGLPSSSSHALIGGLVGAALVSGGLVKWAGVFQSVILPMFISPLIGFTLAYLLMTAIMWSFRRVAPAKVSRGFRIAQRFSVAGLSLGHGLQDAQKTMGVIVLALVIGGHQTTFDVPVWVTVSAALAISAGTYSGGWRIMRTLGRRVIDLDPPRGFAAETTSALVLYTTAFIFKAPVSTTHVMSSGIMGVGATRRVKAVRWAVARSMVTAWILTLPAAAAAAALVYLVVHLVTGA